MLDLVGTFDAMAHVQGKLHELQHERIAALSKREVLPWTTERRYNKLRSESIELLKRVRLNSTRVEHLVEQLYELNRRLVGEEGRLLRLAEIYEVPADQLLPRELEGEISLIDATTGNGLDTNAKFTIDLVRLHEIDDPDAHILDRFATSLQRERQDFNGRLLTIRRSDLRVLASCMGRSLEELGVRLEQLGLRAASAT